MFDAIKLFYSCVGVIFVIYLLGYSTFLILSVLYGSLELYREKKKKKWNYRLFLKRQPVMCQDLQHLEQRGQKHMMLNG